MHLTRTPLHCILSTALLGAASAPGFGAEEPPKPPHLRQLTHTVNAYGCFSPDGKRIVFQSNATGPWQLYTIGVDGSGLAPLLRSEGNDITPVYSPDGARILFVSERDGNREVYVCDADGSNQRNLSNDASMDIHPMWSADGSRIIFSSNRGKDDPDDYDIYEMAADGSDVRQITSGPEIDTYASWSPDGTQIVTRRVIDNKQNNEVFVLNADGTGAVNLSDAPADYDGWPVWSPDGAWICYAGGGPDHGNRYLFLVRPDGSQRTRITSPWAGDHCYDTQPSFSRDGAKLVFTRYHPRSAHESAELVIMVVPKLG